MTNMRRYTPLILLFVALAVFIPLQHCEFLLWDDFLHLAGNPLLQRARGFVEMWTQPYGAIYSPVVYTVWGIFSRVVELFKSDWSTTDFVYPFLALNLVVHVLNSILVLKIMQENFGRKPWAAWFTALIFLVHPLQVESVVWASGLRELLWVFFALLTILFYMRQNTRKMFLFFALAISCKPTAAILPLLLLAFDKKRMKPAVFLEMLAVSLALLLYTKGLQPDVFTADQTTLAQRFLVVLDSLGFYVQKFFWPMMLSPDYGRRPALVISEAPTHAMMIGLAVLILTVALLYRWRKRTDSLTWGLYSLFLPLLPVLGFVPFAFQNYSTVADRYTYFSVFGFALLATSLAEKAPRWLLVALIAVYAVKSHQQATIWRTNEQLFTHTLAFNPKSFMAENNLGVLAQRGGNPSAALTHFVASLKLNMNYFEAAKNVGATLINTDQYDQAIEFYEEYIRRDPNQAEFHMGYGSALLGLNQYDAAIYELTRATELDPKMAIAFENLAIALSTSGRHQDAIPHFRRALVLDPGNAVFQINLERAINQ
jgi:protein O-mannosyl-transferase